MPHPSKLTRLKKNFIYARPIVSLMNKHMVRKPLPKESLLELDMTQRLRTNTPASRNIYNVVMTSREMIAAKVDSWSPKLDWLYSKHVVLANYGDDVRFAGEMWKDEDGCIHFNAKSGTYTPNDEDLENMLRLARRMFPTLNLQADHIQFH